MAYETQSAASPSTGLSPAPGASEGAASGRLPTRIALWNGARERGETGMVAAEGVCTFALFEVPVLPDFSSPRFPDLSALDEAQRVQGMGQLLQRLWWGATSVRRRVSPKCAVSCDEKPSFEAFQPNIVWLTGRIRTRPWRKACCGWRAC